MDARRRSPAISWLGRIRATETRPPESLAKGMDPNPVAIARCAPPRAVHEKIIKIIFCRSLAPAAKWPPPATRGPARGTRLRDFEGRLEARPGNLGAGPRPGPATWGPPKARPGGQQTRWGGAAAQPCAIQAPPSRQPDDDQGALKPGMPWLNSTVKALLLRSGGNRSYTY